MFEFVLQEAFGCVDFLCKDCIATELDIFGCYRGNDPAFQHRINVQEEIFLFVTE